jgi:hypothetical protein
MQEALPAAKAIADYAQKEHGLKIEVYLQQFGPAGTVYWTSEYKDLANVEKMQNALMADAGYWATVNKVSESLIEGSVSFALLQSI